MAFSPVVHIPERSAPPTAIEQLSMQDCGFVFLGQQWWPTWLRRRVESVTFETETVARIRVSLDVELPTWLSAVSIRQTHPPRTSADYLLVPIALFEKRQLTGFDMRDEAGQPIPVLNTRENGFVTTQSALAWAHYQVDVPATAEVDKLIEAVIRRPIAEAAIALRELRDKASADSYAKGVIDAMGGWLERWQNNFSLIALLPSDSLPHRVLKFSWEADVPSRRDNLTRWKRFKSWCGWDPHVIHLELPGSTRVESYHLEITVPEGLSVEGVVVSDADGDGADVYARTGRSTSEVPRVHLHVGNLEHASSPVARMSLRASRRGWWLTSMATSWAVAFVLLVCALRASAIAEVQALHATDEMGTPSTGRVTSDAAAVIVGAVAVIAAIVSRPGEHALTARVVRCVNYLNWLVLSVPVAAAVSIAFGPSGEALDPWVRAESALAVVFASIMSVLWAAPWINLWALARHQSLLRSWMHDMSSHRRSARSGRRRPRAALSTPIGPSARHQRPTPRSLPGTRFRAATRPPAEPAEKLPPLAEEPREVQRNDSVP